MVNLNPHLTEEEHNEYMKWYESRPPHIKAFIDKYPPSQLYRFKDSKKQFVIIQIDEELDDSITLVVKKTGRGGILDDKRNAYLRNINTNKVFGVKPEDIEPVPPEDIRK